MAQPKRSRPRSTRRPNRTQKLAAQAFRDAVRDIVAVEGVFTLADEAERNTIYHFDGVHWMREELPARRRTARLVEVEVELAATGTTG
jgi:hypothetical protein